MRVEKDIQKKSLLILVVLACVALALYFSAHKAGAAYSHQGEGLTAKVRLPQPDGIGTTRIALDMLPRQGRQTYRLIHLGGPFPYGKDGTVFGNRERLLPFRKRGYYREYTVRTPRVKHRGARRIVCGGWVAHRPKACYYTADHYDSFQLIDASGSVSEASVINQLSLWRNA